MAAGDVFVEPGLLVFDFTLLGRLWEKLRHTIFVLQGPIMLSNRPEQRAVPSQGAHIARTRWQGFCSTLFCELLLLLFFS